MFHVAAHEAGHAVAYIRCHQALGRHWQSFDRVLIRRDFSTPYVDDRGREIECAGLCEAPDVYCYAGGIGLSVFEQATPDLRKTILAEMEWAIRINLAGPFATAASQDVRTNASMRWHALLYCGSLGDYRSAEAVLADYRVAKGRNSYQLTRFENQARTLVLENWRPIEALALLLLKSEVLDHEIAYQVVADNSN